jgi:ferredoxin
MKIVHDETKCASSGMCEAVAPEFFEIGDDGALRLLNVSPADCHYTLVRQAVVDCPTGALSIGDCRND